MHRFIRSLTLASLLLVGASSCVDQIPSAPLTGAAGRAASRGAEKALPGHKRAGTPNGQQNAWLVQCENHPAFEGSGDIGPSGGHIIAGPHRLIIPPGALLHTVHITATVPAGDNVFVEFQPSGLVFRKPAGLLLDAEGCDLSQYHAPDVVYLNDAGDVEERIDAVYSNHWKTVAAPIWHFSGYAIAW